MTKQMSTPDQLERPLPKSTEDVVRELQRCNFHHVNDVDEMKSWSYDWCSAAADLISSLVDANPTKPDVYNKVDNEFITEPSDVDKPHVLAAQEWATSDLHDFPYQTPTLQHARYLGHIEGQRYANAIGKNIGKNEANHEASEIGKKEPQESEGAEFANEFVFETHGDKFSNNNDEAGNAVTAYLAGWDKRGEVELFKATDKTVETQTYRMQMELIEHLSQQAERDRQRAADLENQIVYYKRHEEMLARNVFDLETQLAQSKADCERLTELFREIKSEREDGPSSYSMDYFFDFMGDAINRALKPMMSEANQEVIK